MQRTEILLAIVAITSVSTSLMVMFKTAEVKSEVRVATGKIQKIQEDLNDVKTKQALLIKTQERITLSPTERKCLTRNVFFEAGVENKEGKIAVAQTTLNRVRHKRWKSDVCGVVRQKAQFSWTLDKKKKNSTPSGELWEKSKQAVQAFESGVRVRGLNDALFYHTDYIKPPKWADQSDVIMQVGRHIFYSNDVKS